MIPSKHFTTTPPILTPNELTVVRQLRTLFEVFDKTLRAVLAHPTHLRHTVHKAHDLSVGEITLTSDNTPRRRATDLPLTLPTTRRTRTPGIIYRVKDGRIREPRGLSERDLGVYQAISHMAKGITRKALLGRLHATVHTGIVDGAVRRLRLKRLIVAERTTV